MKRVYFTIIILLGAMITLIYLYFSKLNRETNGNEISLYTATAKSALIFSFENEKSILELLGSQNLLQRLIPEDKLRELQSLQREVLGIPEIKALISKENIYLSLIPGENKNIDFLISTQSYEAITPEIIANLFKAKGITLERLEDFSKFTLSDTSTFYFAQRDNLLLLSSSFKAVSDGLKVQSQKNPEFIAYIKSDQKLNKNSLAALYLNFNELEGLSKAISPKKFSTILPLLNKQNAFGNFRYSFSKERILFSGNTKITGGTSYLNLFAATPPEKITIDAILPEQTANYTIYVPGDYQLWHQRLVKWFEVTNKADQVNKVVKRVNAKYHLDLDKTFPSYFKNQMMTFQLKSGETLGAINLTNGDKLSQLLIDVSAAYNPDIKILKEPQLLYSYFGDALDNFNRPYYTIIDNFMVFSNYPSSLQVFLNSYRSNKQLIRNKAYLDAFNQLAAESSVVYYLHRENAGNLARRHLFLPYYQMYLSKENLGDFEGFIYQMSGDELNTFQTNLLINLTPKTMVDSIPSF